jgi:SAM-dependent methyltransferase
MDWRVKGVIQKILGRLPGGETAHYWLQRVAGGLRNFPRECDGKIMDLTLMIGHLRSVGVAVGGVRFLEIGSGWYPTFPLGLYLLGAARVETFDLHRHLKPDLVRALVARLGGHVPTLAALDPARDEDAIVARWTRLSDRVSRGATLEEATSGCVRYHAPADAARTGLAPGAVDAVFSNSVLEHVPEPAIAAIFAEAARILPARGVMFHSVNCGDHYSYFDRSINQLNYLRFSEAEWARWNNAFLYQNRLRARDFTRLAREAGFVVEIDTSRPRPERLRQLDAIRVAPMFEGYEREQLAITSIDFVARKP